MELLQFLVLVLSLCTEVFTRITPKDHSLKAPYRVNIRNKYPNGGPSRDWPINLKSIRFVEPTTSNPFTPTLFTAGFINGKKKPAFADTKMSELFSLSQRIKFNAIDKKDKPGQGNGTVQVDRRSYEGEYSVERISKYIQSLDLPESDPSLDDAVDMEVALNPTGPTGIWGRGELAKYGPNHAADIAPIRIAPKCLSKEKLPENKLECIEIMNITRKEGGDAAMCGGMVDDGEEPHVTMKREYLEEAFNLKGYALRIKMAERIKLIPSTGRNKEKAEEKEDLKAIIVHFFHNNKDVHWAISKAEAVKTVHNTLSPNPLPAVPGLPIPTSQLNIVKSVLAFYKLESEKSRAIALEKMHRSKRLVNLSTHISPLISKARVLLQAPQNKKPTPPNVLQTYLEGAEALVHLGLTEWNEYKINKTQQPVEKARIKSRQNSIDQLNSHYKNRSPDIHKKLETKTKNDLIELVNEIETEINGYKADNSKPAEKLEFNTEEYEADQDKFNLAIEYVQGLISNAELPTRIPELILIIAELKKDKDPEISFVISGIAQSVVQSYMKATIVKVNEVKIDKSKDPAKKYEAKYNEVDVKKFSTLKDIKKMAEKISILKDVLFEAEMENNIKFKKPYKFRRPEIAERLIHLRRMIDVVQALEPLKWLTDDTAINPLQPTHRIQNLKDLMAKDFTKKSNEANIQTTKDKKLTLEHVYTDPKDSFILPQLADEDRVEDIDLMDEMDEKLSDKMAKILEDFDKLFADEAHKKTLLDDVNEIIDQGKTPLEERMKLAWVLAVEFEKNRVVWTVYAGFVDDWRNADLAWMETVCFLVIFNNEMANYTTTLMEAGDDAREVNWVPITKNMRLFASHFRMVNRIVEYLESSEIKIQPNDNKTVSYFPHELVSTPTDPRKITKKYGLRFDFLYTRKPTEVV